MKSSKRVRFLKVSYYFDSSTPEAVAFIRLKGKWLASAGFTIDMPIKVLILQGQLIITQDRTKANRVRDAEVASLQKRLAELEKETTVDTIEKNEPELSADQEEVVICDNCNRVIEDEQEEGGSFMGSYSVCPRCTERVVRLADEKEKATFQFIQGSFKRAVLKKRQEFLTY